MKHIPPGSTLALDPLAHRERGPLVRQELDRLGIGIEDGADRFRHTRCLRRSQRIGDRAAHQTCTLARSAVISSRARASLLSAPRARKLEAHLDEQQTRGEHPELLRAPTIMRHKCFSRGGELGLVAALVEHVEQGQRASSGFRITSRSGIEEVLDEVAGEIEDHGPLAALARLLDHVRKQPRSCPFRWWPMSIAWLCSSRQDRSPWRSTRAR